jgi:transcriptional regulator with XRE-family HTH domain
MTLGDLLRKCRLDRGLRQGEVARDIGCSLASVRNWEVNRNNVSFHHLARVYDFIGICPYDSSLPVGGRLRERREYLGYSIKAVALMLGADPCTVAYWERGDHSPTKASLAKIRCFLQMRTPE